MALHGPLKRGRTTRSHHGEAGQRSHLPEPPASLPEAARDLWVAEIDALAELGLALLPGDAAILSRYFCARIALAQCERALIEHGPVWKDPEGRIKQNPAGPERRRISTELLAIERELTLTPATRRKLSIYPDIPDPDNPWAEFDRTRAERGLGVKRD